jgi:biopolymer transport protein ExbB
MKQGLFNTVVIVVSAIVGVVVFYFLPKFIKDGGYLVVALIALIFLVLTYVTERILVIRKAQGTGSLSLFLKNVQQEVSKGNIDGAIAVCDKQRGSCANVLRTGLDRYKVVTGSSEQYSEREVMEEVQHSIDEAMMLEVPLLEKNLVSLSTIASISTMIGLLGTVVGMIRSFAAMAHAGAPDAIQLALGISEALINTAGGLIGGITGIVAYNFFTTKVDNFTYMIEEASYSIIQTLTLRTRTTKK